MAQVLDVTLSDMPVENYNINTPDEENEKIRDGEESLDDKISSEDAYHPNTYLN